MKSHFQKPGISNTFFGTKSTEGTIAAGALSCSFLLLRGLLPPFQHQRSRGQAENKDWFSIWPPKGGLCPHRGDGSQPSISHEEPSSRRAQKHLHQCQPQQQRTFSNVLGTSTWKFRDGFSRTFIYTNLHWKIFPCIGWAKKNPVYPCGLAGAVLAHFCTNRDGKANVGSETSKPNQDQRP